MIKLVEYSKEHQSAIDEMMQNISLEFPDELSSKTPHNRPLPPDAYWVALYDEAVIGTVGVSAGNEYAILKSMMVMKEFRGESIGLSKQLLQTAIDWCLSINISTIYLGTMTQFRAAQRFYAKYGFEKIPERELPSDFIINPVDSIFFRLVYSRKIYL